MPYVDQMTPAVESLPVSLAVFSVVAGVAMLLLFRAVSRPDAIRTARRRMQARLLELRLFGDEPALVWRAQVGLLTANLRYLRAMIVPIAVVSIPFVLAFPYLEALYGRAPLPVGSSTVLTLRMRDPFGATLPSPRITAPPGLRVETPAVRVPDAREISWELRAEGPVSQPVRIDLGSVAMSKMVKAGSRGGYLAQTASTSPMAWILDPGEHLTGAPAVDSIHVEYRGLRLSVWSWELPWEAWFVAISMVAALVGKSYWRVAF